jgi:exodeoxyribonuclease VII large subunit
MAIETSPEHPAPVRQITQAIGQWIDRLGPVWVEGQVTQISRRGGMNTVFLTLRDKLADISVQVTCNRGVVDSLPTPLVEGAQIVCHAKPSFYPNRGTLSLNVREIRLVGEGELLARLERRRQLLAAEGLFAEELKRRLPFLPRAVGLVTAQNSAAERDVLEHARRRWPGVQVTVKYAAMQGMNAAREVIEAVQSLDRDPEVDVIVIARGGGSVEDLLPFSDEGLVRAVHAVTTPVVSAIGHEPDSPILDLVADVRASTPTDAAKRVVPDVTEELDKVAQLRRRTESALRALLDRETAALRALRSRPVVADPHNLLAPRAEEVAALRDRGRRVLRASLDRAGDNLAHTRARVTALSPAATLERGYAVLQRADGTVVRRSADVAVGDALRARLSEGEVGLVVGPGQPDGGRP